MRALLLGWLFVLGCHPSAPVAPGGTSFRMGNAHRTIHTSSPEAQRRFDAGLAALYAFNYDEAAFEFVTAMRADPTCAMCAWGYAMALGPNINAQDKQAPGAHEAATRAQTLARTPVEQALTRALVARFVPAHMELMPVTPDARKQLNTAYAEAMRAVVKQFDDDDTQVCLAEALLITTSWFDPNYKPDGTPASPLVPEARAAIERVLARAPAHAGAIHYYIHVLDGGPDAGKGVPFAAKLAALAPDAGHLIHMPAHLYYTLGRYAEAEDANLAAIAADQKYLAASQPGQAYARFTMHPQHYLWYVMLVEGKRAEAERLAGTLGHHAAHAGDPMAEDFGASYRPLTDVRFGLWDDALALPAGRGRLSSIATHFARGLALAAKGKLDDAALEADAIRKVEDKAAPLAPGTPEPPVVAIVRAMLTARQAAAALELEGAVAEARGDHARAIELLRQALVEEAKIAPEGELPTWPLAIRQRLGAVLLAAGKPADAEAVYRADLEVRPENGWALFGLARALDDQHHPDARQVHARFDAAWKRAETTLTSSVK
ncbi:MAG: hypothetical protein NT062_21165 [Proteobacteria bacterium]|nr:hypothetical protein [Pseudomonadota bacterium]